jgi:hypothetical protein
MRSLGALHLERIEPHYSFEYEVGTILKYFTVHYQLFVFLSNKCWLTFQKGTSC